MVFYLTIHLYFVIGFYNLIDCKFQHLHNQNTIYSIFYTFLIPYLVFYRQVLLIAIMLIVKFNIRLFLLEYLLKTIFISFSNNLEQPEKTGL